MCVHCVNNTKRRPPFLRQLEASLCADMILRRTARLTTPTARGIVHVPVLAAMAKLGGLTALKKVALSKVLQRVGPEKAIRDLRELNGRLRQSSERVPHSAHLADAADQSLAALERSLQAVKGEERVQRLWAWYTSLEKKNPTLADAVLKTYLEVLPGMRWANLVLKGTPPPQDASSSGSSEAVSSGGGARPLSDLAAGTSARPLERAAVGSDEHAATMLQHMRRSHPQVFSNYHVILVPREDEVARTAQRAAEHSAEHTDTSSTAERTSEERSAAEAGEAQTPKHGSDQCR